jgi:hypothetical protein
MFIFEKLFVEFVPFDQLTSQEKSAWHNFYITDTNPGGLYKVGKTYSVLGINDRGSGTWQCLIASERNTFNWIPLEILRYSSSTSTFANQPTAEPLPTHSEAKEPTPSTATPRKTKAAS